MKKSILFLAGLVGLALTSCEDDKPLGTMQKNEAPIEVPAQGVALQSLFASTGNSINLQDYEETINISLVDIELSSTFPAGSVVTGEVEIADNIDFKNAQTIKLSSVEASKNQNLANAAGGDTRSYEGIVSATAWNEAFQAFYGLNPAANVNYLRYRLWLTNEKQNVILYSSNGSQWFDVMQFTVTPFDAKLDVAASYTLNYLVNNTGDVHTVKMYHNPEKHVYDDPNFNATVEVTETDAGDANVVYWWITPDDNSGKAFGVESSDPAAEAGNLGLKESGEYVNGQLGTPGVFKIEANMLDLTYSVKLAPPSLYVVSTSYIQFPQAAQLGTADNVVYEGMAGIESAWGLTGQAAYRPTLYSNDADVEVVKNGNTTTGGLLFDTTGAPLNSNTAIPLPGTRGMFYVTADLQTLKYTAYRCNTIGITGSMAGVEWGAGPDIQLKNSRTTYYMEWSGNLTVSAGDEWKIRANDDWAVNFGAASGNSYTTDGTPVELAKDGGNFVATESGTYKVTVHFRRYLENGKLTPYYMTLTPAN